MLQDGILKMLDGQTSLEEVLRVVGKTDYIDDLYDIVVSPDFGARELPTIKEADLQFGEAIAMNIIKAGTLLANKPTN